MGFVVPSVGSIVAASIGSPVAGSILSTRTSPKFQLTYMRSPANGPDGTYWMAPVPCYGSVTNSTAAPGV